MVKKWPSKLSIQLGHVSLLLFSPLLEFFSCGRKGFSENAQIAFKEVFLNSNPKILNSIELNEQIPLTDVNNMIVREEQNTNDEIRRQWEEHDRNRRTKTLAQNWPNRANYEAQLQRIANINKNQGKIFYFLQSKYFVV